MGATLSPAELNYIQIPLVTDNWNWDVALQWNSLENQRRINQSNVWWTLSLDIRHFFASSAGMEHSLTNRSFSLSHHYNKSISNKYQANWIVFSNPILMINSISPLSPLSVSQHSGNDSNDVENNNNRSHNHRSFKREKESSKEQRLSNHSGSGGGGNESSNGLKQDVDTDDEDGIDFKCVVCDLQCQDVEQWVVCMTDLFTFLLPIMFLPFSSPPTPWAFTLLLLLGLVGD